MGGCSERRASSTRALPDRLLRLSREPRRHESLCTMTTGRHAGHRILLNRMTQLRLLGGRCRLGRSRQRREDLTSARASRTEVREGAQVV